MTSEELKKYKRDWIKKLRQQKMRVRVRIDGSGYRYKETYIKKPKDYMKNCPICTMLFESSWHSIHEPLHPQSQKQAEEMMVMKILKNEE